MLENLFSGKIFGMLMYHSTNIKEIRETTKIYKSCHFVAFTSLEHNGLQIGNVQADVTVFIK